MLSRFGLDPSNPSVLPEAVLSAVSTLVGLFATQGLITNNTEKLVTGSASVLVPLLFLAGQALIKAAHAHKAAPAVTAAPAPVVSAVPTPPAA